MANRTFPLKLVFRLREMPCRVCGRPDDIEIDHVVPFVKGGSSTEENAQPLCHVCNKVKRHTRTNKDVAEWINRNLEKFYRDQDRRSRIVHEFTTGIWLEPWIHPPPLIYWTIKCLKDF